MESNLLKLINEIALILKAKGQTFTRSDLAFQLSDYGVKDDVNLERAVYLSQKKYNFPTGLFVMNNHGLPIVEAYEMYIALDQMNADDVDQVAKNHKKKNDVSLKNAQKALEIKVEEESLKVAGNITSVLTGSKGIENMRAKAEMVFDKYCQMVDMYNHAKNNVSLTIDDFVTIRGEVQKQFMSYASMLVDIFGNRIKVVAPEMFDFKQVEWLDVSSMYKQIELDFNTITSKCGQILSEITNSFRNSLQQSSQTYKSVNDKRIGLALAGLNLIGHYLDSYSQTNVVKSDLMHLEKSMARDAAQIRGDLMRLTTLHKAINDVQIPCAVIFLKHSKGVLDCELSKIVDLLYVLPEAKELHAKREHLLLDIKEEDSCIQDRLSHINYYSTHIKDTKELLSSMATQYNDAKFSLPQKPFFLFNWLSLGTLGGSYRRKLAVWNQTCMPVVQSYEGLEVDLKLDTEDLEKYNKELSLHKNNYQKLLKELEMVNSKLISLVNADDTVKAKLLSSLKDILRLMALAKEITQVRLNENLIHITKINQYEDWTLPAELNKSVDTFINAMHDNIAVTKEDAIGIVDEFSGTIAGSSEYAEEDLQAVMNKGQECVHKSIDICKQMIELQKQKINTESAKLHYQQELTRLQELFKKQYKQFESQSNTLLEVIRELNTGNSYEDVKTALQKLSDGGLVIPTDEDLQKFIEGKKIIEI